MKASESLQVPPPPIRQTSILTHHCPLLLQQVRMKDVSLEGDITVPGAPQPGDDDEAEFNTLDEPVKETIVRNTHSL